MKITQEYIDAAGEVEEILGYMDKEEYDNIPIKLINFFKEIKSKDYIPHIKRDIPLKEQNLNDKTKSLLAFIYRKYLSNEEQKLEFDNKIKENDIRYKEFIESSYGKDVEEIFKVTENNE